MSGSREIPSSSEPPADAFLGAPDARDFLDTTEVLQRARDGSSLGFEELWRRFVPALQVCLAGKLHSYAHTKLGARLVPEIPDLLQTTMLKASRHLGDFDYRGPGSLLAWLRQIALNEFKNRVDYWLADRRDVNRDGVHLLASGTNPVGPDPRAQGPGPRTTAEIDEQRRQVGAALETLDEIHRDLLLFRFFAGASWAEIAQQLGYPSPDAARMDCTRHALPAFALALHP